MQKLKFNDGGKKNSVYADKNCCAVRAISISLGISYDLVYLILYANGRKKNSGTYLHQIENTLNELKKLYVFDWHKIPIPDTVSISTEQVITSYTGGTYIIAQRQHVVCCIDGVLQDTFLTLKKRVELLYKIDIKK